MGKLINGRWTTGAVAGNKGEFKRDATTFRDWITTDGSTPYAPEPGRYHLYVSYACPWAHRTIIGRRLHGLEDSISMSVVQPHMGEDGWTLDEGVDPIHGARYLRDVYLAADENFTGRVTVPVLWDKTTGTIVNNESKEVLRMFDQVFDHAGNVELWPDDLADDIDAMIDANYNTINNGVYRCGFAGSQEAYDRAVHELFERLDACEDILGRQRYLCGDRMTAADICLFTTLYRFDAVYYIHFKCNIRRIVDYPNLWGFARDMYQLPGVAETCHMDHVRVHYYTSHESVNPRRIIPAGAPPDFTTPHGRG